MSPCSFQAVDDQRHERVCGARVNEAQIDRLPARVLPKGVGRLAAIGKPVRFLEESLLPRPAGLTTGTAVPSMSRCL